VKNRPRPVVVVAANTAWFITNFCAGLVRGLRQAGYEPVVVAPADPLVERSMRALGVRHYPVAVQRSGLNPFADLRLFFAYRGLLKRLRPTAWFSYTIKPNIYGSLAGRLNGIPAFPNVTGLGTAFIRQGPLQQVVTRLYRAAFRRLPVVFFQNEEDRQLFVERAIVQSGQARVAALGIDLDHFAPAPLSDGPPTFLLIARLLRDKGVVEFAQAARSLRAALPNAQFQLLGPIDEGNRTAIGRAELDHWVTDGVVEYLGTTDDVRPFIAAATAIVLPSYREGLPRSLLEAAAMERPLIATDVPGCREVVEDGSNGYLCRVRDPASLAAAMKRLAELSDEDRLAMGQAARRQVQERFSEEFVIRAYLDVLAELKTV
jgi:glycosyltransferase involved in cell wall biosynthesis